MVTVVPMPKLGAGVYREGTILKWMKKEGDQVAEREPIAEIETEKAIMTYDSPSSGVVLKLLVSEGETVSVGDPVCIIGEPGEPVPSDILRAGAAAVVQKAVGDVEPAPPPPPAQVSPAAKRLAESLGVDVARVNGTGPGGTVMREDVLRASRETPRPGAQAPRQQEGEKLIPLSTMRATIAERLSKSQRETAHVTLTREVDVVGLVSLIKGGDLSRQGVTYTDVFVKAVAEALRRHPMMNSRLEGGKVRLLERINVSVAVAVEGGLVTPTVRDADRLPLADVSRQMKELSEKARQRRLTSADLADGTFTVSNLGMFGIDAFTPIINPPQAAILGTGRIIERPWVEGGAVKVSPTVVFSLTFDHRIVDGADAARFLDTFVNLLRDTSWLRP